MTKSKDSHGTIRCNIPICGGPASGKTSLICQYASLGRDFPKLYKMTVGTELSIVDVKIQNEQMDVKLQLLDTGGHPAQRSLVEHGLGDGHDFCCLVYSVADKASFLAVKHWHSILSARTTKPKASLKGVLVASKIDLPVSMHQVCQGCMKMCEEAAAWLGLHSSVQVQQDEGETLANELGMELILASGMRLADARRPFEQLARLIIDEYKSEVSRIEECVLAM